MPNPESARKEGSFMAVCISPDPCKTPPNNAPVPYYITASLDDALAVSPDVKYKGKPVVLVDESRIANVKGDEAGSGGGVKSGTNGEEVKFVTGAGSVKANGMRIARDKDEVSMNKGNTKGRIQSLTGAAPGSGDGTRPADTEKPSENIATEALAQGKGPLNPSAAEAELIAERRKAIDEAIPGINDHAKDAVDRHARYNAEVSPDQLRRIMPMAKGNADKYCESLNSAMKEFEINNPQRQSMFLSQVAWESGDLRFTEENLNHGKNGLLNTFPKYFDEDSAADFAHKPESIANRVYANRIGNGSEASGDGWTFRGRGLIQTTGRANYDATGKALSMDLINHPEVLADDVGASSRAAAQFFKSRGCNGLADNNDFKGVTRVVNGSAATASQRRPYYDRAYEILTRENLPSPKKPLLNPDEFMDFRNRLSR